MGVYANQGKLLKKQGKLRINLEFIFVRAWTIYSLEGTCRLLSKVDEFSPTRFHRILSFSAYLGYFSNENIQKSPVVFKFCK